MKFHGKNVLVTGATSGVGREAAKLFAQHGAAVIVTGRDETRGHAVVEELATASAPARFIAADLNVSDDVRRLIQEAGDVDILVNNAGFWNWPRPRRPPKLVSTPCSRSTSRPRSC